MIQIENDAKWNCLRTFGKKCFKICFVLGAVGAFVSILLLIGSLIVKSTEYVQVIYIDKEKPYVTKTNVKFLSIGLDSSVIAEDFHNFNTTDVKLLKMVQYLTPAYLRVGGSLADKLIFDADLKEIDPKITKFYIKSSNYNNYLDLFFSNLDLPNFKMTGLQWLKLMKFAQQVGLDVTFGLNALRRFKNGSWDYTNAESLINFSSDHNLRINWELGNEPNSFRHKFQQVVNATQMAKDFVVLRDILKRYSICKNSLLLGPDTTRPRVNHQESQIYLRKFLQNASDVIDAITWHQYYLNGRTAVVSDFLNPSVFDCLKSEIRTVNEIKKNLKIQNKPVWLGETSSAYGGGAPNLSNTFVASFLWLDKLGLAAKMGIKVVIRQSIFKGYYALLDSNYDPNPDWWISILFKKLVGLRVVPSYTSCSRKVRLYCHCTKRSVLVSNLPSVTVFGINFDKNAAQVRIEGLFPVEIEAQALSTVYAFEITSEKLLCSKGVRLNGQLLKMTKDNNLPELVPKIVDATSFVTMPPFSIVFWVIPTTHVKACL